MIKQIYVQSIVVWIILVPVAIINAIIRELTYVPLLEPYIGNWAHQISVFTGIGLFYFVMWLFFRWTKAIYTKKDLRNIGAMWVLLTVAFEFLFGHYVMNHTWQLLVEQYHFWKGDLWVLLLIFILFAPRIIAKKPRQIRI